MTLLPMDIACLKYIALHGGEVPSAGIPSRMFVGEIPIELPSLADMGLIEHVGESTRITDAGRKAIP